MSDQVTAPFGALPDDWKYEKIGENVEFATGPAFDSTQFNIEGIGHRLVRGINLTIGATRWGNGNAKYWKNLTPEFKKYELQTGDVVIGMDGSLVGKNYAQIRDNDLPALLVQRVARLRCKAKLNQRFLYYMFGNDAWISYVEIVKTNSGIPHISNGDIKDFRIPFPKSFEQQKIASILTAVDDVIESTQAQINKLKDLKTGMMQELLTKGIGHTKFKDSPVGPIPAGWQLIRLGDISEHITKGGTPTTYGFEWVESGVLFLRSESVKRGEFSLDGSMFISKKAHESMARSRVIGGDILISITGYIGSACFFPHSLNEANINQHIARVRLKSILLSQFVVQYINSDFQLKRFLNIQTGQAYPQLSLKQVQDTLIPCPPENEMRVIVLALESIDRKLNVAMNKNKNINALKKALMQDLLTGKVRVKVN